MVISEETFQSFFLVCFFHYADITLNGVWIAKAVSEIHRHETNRSLNFTDNLGLN